MVVFSFRVYTSWKREELIILVQHGLICGLKWKRKVKSQKDNYVFLEVERVVVGLGEGALTWALSTLQEDVFGWMIIFYYIWCYWTIFFSHTLFESQLYELSTDYFLKLAKLHKEVDNLKRVEMVNFVTYITILENHIRIKRYHCECVDNFSTTPNPKILFLLKEYSWIIRVGNAFELEVLKDEK